MSSWTPKDSDNHPYDWKNQIDKVYGGGSSWSPQPKPQVQMLKQEVETLKRLLKDKDKLISTLLDKLMGVKADD